MVDKQLNKTTIIETNFGRTNITTRRKIKWEEIEFPENWVMNNTNYKQQYIDNNPINIVQTLEGTVQIEFDKIKSKITRSLSSRSTYSHISPLGYIVKSPSRTSTFQIREEYPEDRVEELRINSDNMVRGVYRTQNDPELTESEMNFSV